MRVRQALGQLIQKPNSTKSRGQSLIEVALALPIMLIMISGLIEFGFALNQYLNALDAAREAARYATDSDPLDRDFSGGVTNTDCATTLDFYMQAACIGVQTMAPVDFNPATDDVVVSVFRVLSGTVIGRWPNCEPGSPDDCPIDPPSAPETMGEWHLFGRGSGCDNGLDDDGDGPIDDGCPSGPPVNGASEFCNPAIDTTCHPSRLTPSDVEGKLEADAPDSAVLLVEVFYGYGHVLRLPWITPFVPDPLPLHTYTILPLPAAEPSLTITGTVTRREPGGSFTPLAGVTILFNNGMIAITDSDGQYVRTGLSSSTYTLTADNTGTGCQVEAPNPQSVTLGITNVYNVNFIMSSCIDVTATNIAATITSAAATNVAGTSTMAAATATAAAATGTSTPTPTSPGAPTATIDPSCTPGTVDTVTSRVEVEGASLVQADGFDPLTVKVTVVDTCGLPVSGQLVALGGSRPDGGSHTITSADPYTDIDGVAWFSVVSGDMSDWSGGTFQPTTFTATVLGYTIGNTAQGVFACVGVTPGTHGTNQVGWTFHNVTGIDRRLVGLVFDRGAIQDAADVFNSLRLGTPQIFATPIVAPPPPVTITFGWTADPNDRIVPAGQARELLVSTTFPVGGQPFTVWAEWRNLSDLSRCYSDPLTVTP